MKEEGVVFCNRNNSMLHGLCSWKASTKSLDKSTNQTNPGLCAPLPLIYAVASSWSFWTNLVNVRLGKQKLIVLTLMVRGEWVAQSVFLFPGLATASEMSFALKTRPTAVVNLQRSDQSPHISFLSPWRGNMLFASGTSSDNYCLDWKMTKSHTEGTQIAQRVYFCPDREHSVVRIAESKVHFGFYFHVSLSHADMSSEKAAGCLFSPDCPY